ncbi:MAG: hypothetical protein DCF19_23705 [Pseudanabaena frigida]|uniref:Uncharacterized protein n=1 Tax=Pseudanabaena frigida TaxID=945775 RepID=A0A2W4XVZ0_9CYAN|nr:MAG: hypothetical protein DCF19_23705 [Pseudanabaena frigida]
MKASTKVLFLLGITICTSLSSCKAGAGSPPNNQTTQPIQPVQQIEKAKNVAAEVVVTVMLGDAGYQISVDCRDGKAQPLDAKMPEAQLKEFEIKKPSIVADACPNRPK